MCSGPLIRVFLTDKPCHWGPHAGYLERVLKREIFLLFVCRHTNNRNIEIIIEIKMMFKTSAILMMGGDLTQTTEH